VAVEGIFGLAVMPLRTKSDVSVCRDQRNKRLTYGSNVKPTRNTPWLVDNTWRNSRPDACLGKPSMNVGTEKVASSAA